METSQHKPVSVGIAGLGRSGWDIHARCLKGMPEQFRVVAAMDFDAARRGEAETTLGARTYDNYAALLGDAEVEVVVVATPNRFHTENVLEALRAGKHVVCEKPFGTKAGDVEAMIGAATEAKRLVVPFQQRRFEPGYQKVREVVESGVLGEIQLIRCAWHSFGRRWDWQTLRELEGGQLLNNAPHALDQTLQLWGDHPYTLTTDVRNVLTSGDAEDFIKIVLRPQSENGRRAALVEVEMMSCNALPQDRWLIIGDSGTLRADGSSRAEWKWVDWSQLPTHPVDKTPTQNRSYNSETLPWQTAEWTVPKQEQSLEAGFYKSLFQAVREGAPVPISPQSVGRMMRLIEEVQASGEVQQGRFSLANAA